jgi:hypothetical protein
MNRRSIPSLLAAALALAAWMPAGTAAAQAPSPDRLPEPLALYGVALRGADAQAFLDAARAAGGAELPLAEGAAPQLDMRGAGVPALQELTLFVHEGRVASVRFDVKGYGQDNQALRQLLVAKYGEPYTVSPRPLRFGGFDLRAAPRGGFQWFFADGMRLVYEHPRIGGVTLSYVDDDRMQALGGGSSTRQVAPPVDALRDRL